MKNKVECISTNEGHNNSDQLDLAEIIKVLWRSKLLIGFVVLISGVVSVFYALSVPNQYKTTAILIPSNGGGGDALGALASQFGGLASLAGVSVGGGGLDKAGMAVELFKTWGFLESFIQGSNLETEVYAVNGWNKNTNELYYNQKVYDPLKGVWLIELNEETGIGRAPTSWELYQAIRKRIEVNKDVKTGMITLSVEHYSPVLAKKWAELLIEAINKYLQEMDKVDTQKRIKYLINQIENTDIAEMRSIFYRLIEEQTKSLMLAEISQEYAIKTLSAPKVAEQKSKPQRAMICILGVILGAFLSTMFVLIRYFYRGVQ